MRKCKWLNESDSNPDGFKTTTECAMTIFKLRNWIGLKPLTISRPQIADIKGLTFNDALKCRWNRELAAIRLNYRRDWFIQLIDCVEFIQKKRAIIGLKPFNTSQWVELKEKRHVKPFPPMRDVKILSTNQDEQYNFLKIWLDHGGIV